MEFITASLAVFWAWEFIRLYLHRFMYWVPDWLVHLTVIPGLAYLALHAPTAYVMLAAVAGAVTLMTMAIRRDIPLPHSRVKNRRSNIPPPP